MDKDIVLRCWQDLRDEPETGFGLRFAIFNLDDKADRMMLVNEWDEMASIDRFTERFDKHKKPIFENDILQEGIVDIDYDGRALKGIRFELFWDKECGGYRARDLLHSGDYLLEEICWDEVEIIGNKMENPELLKS